MPTVVSAGQTSSGLIISGADSATVLSGGTASAFSVVSGGSVFVTSGGLEIGDTIVGTSGSSTSIEIISLGGLASNTSVGSGGVLDVAGTASGATVFSGGGLTVD